MSIRLLIVFLFFSFITGLESQIVVKQTEDGRVSITNHQAGYFTKKGKKSNKRSVHKVPTYINNRIHYFSKKHGVKPKLVLAVARAESAYNQFAKSKKGAVGIMQLMPGTALQYNVINRYNVDQNIEAGIKHLKYLYKKYNRDIVLTLAAYNAGEQAVLKYNGVPPYRETRNYIRKIFRFMNMSMSGYSMDSKPKSKLFRYRTQDGRIVITDRFPTNIAKKRISIIKNY